MRLEVDTKTKIGIEDKLCGFVEGKVVNVDNTWEPQQDKIVEAVAPQNEHTAQHYGIIEVAAPQNEHRAQLAQQNKIVEASAPQNAHTPQQDEVVEETMAPQNVHPREQDEIVEEIVALENKRPKRFQFDRKTVVLSMFAPIAICLILFLLYVLFDSFIISLHC
jgi:hypothetical protein